MKFNQQELACFASSRQGKSDKEGVLWLREIDGTKVKKKQGAFIAPSLQGVQFEYHYALLTRCITLSTCVW